MNDEKPEGERPRAEGVEPSEAGAFQSEAFSDAFEGVAAKGVAAGEKAADGGGIPPPSSYAGGFDNPTPQFRLLPETGMGRDAGWMAHAAAQEAERQSRLNAAALASGMNGSNRESLPAQSDPPASTAPQIETARGTAKAKGSAEAAGSALAMSIGASARANRQSGDRESRSNCPQSRSPTAVDQ